MKETIKRAFLWALVFLGTILFWFIWYSAWTSLTADIPNQNSWDIMTSAIWNNLVDKLNKTIDNVNLLNTSISNINSVPTWAVMAFNLDTCPTWWTALSSANWKVIVWVWSDWQWNTYTRWITWWEAKHTLSVAEMPSHNHTSSTITRTIFDSTWWWSNYWQDTPSWTWPDIYSNYTWWGQAHENRMPYLALLYCVKN